MEKVRERLMRATAALEAAGIPYAVAGGNAVAAWVSRVDEAAVRNTRDVDILIRREDLERAKEALGAVGFVYRHVKSIDMFLDGPNAKARDAVHLVFACEKVREDSIAAAPDVTQSESADIGQGLDKPIQILDLDALVSMKLTAFRRKDQMHLLDLIDVGLIESGWLQRLPSELAARLKELLDNPEG